MPEVTLTAEAGRATGSSSTRRLRSEGKIPGVVYGHGSDPIPVAVVAREFQVALSGEAGLNTLLSLEVGSDNYLTLARDIQHHPFRNVVTHVDFQIVRRDEVISAEIPINLVGEAIEIRTATASWTSSCSPSTSRPSRPTSRRRSTWTSPSSPSAPPSTCRTSPSPPAWSWRPTWRSPWWPASPRGCRSPPRRRPRPRPRPPGRLPGEGAAEVASDDAESSEG